MPKDDAFMTFELVSFLAGILAGGITGGLAGILYGLERTADIQEALLKMRREIDRISPKAGVGGQPDAETSAKMKELREQLDGINEEIRKMYRKTSR